MSNSQHIVDLLEKLKVDHNSPLIYKDSKVILTYGQLTQSIKKRPSSNTVYELLEWQSNDADFICQYFRYLNHGIIPIPVDKRRLEKSPQDYSIDEIEEALNSGQLKNIENKNDCATIIYTSGSTGKPKGVRLSLESILSAASATRDFYQINTNDNWALSLPLFHIGGIMILWRTLISGASLTITRPENIISDILNNKQITIASFVQLQLENLLKEDQLTRFRDLKGIVLGGSKINSSLISKAIENGIKLSNSFGATETCAQFLATPFTTNKEALSNIGLPMCGETLIKDKKLVLEGKSISLGYLNQENFNGQFITSDKAQINDDGSITIIGRSDDVFQKAAENINPQIIEDKLNKKLASSCYIGPIKNDRYENLIGLVCDETQSLKEVVKRTNKELISFERPHLFYQVNDLKYFQKGIKINRGLIREGLNQVYFNSSEKLRFCVSGKPDGDILIVSHGFMGQSLDLEKYLNTLNEKYLLLYLDLPCHGLNQKLSSLEEFKNEVIRLLIEISKTQKKINFITYSMSARIFQELLRDERLRDMHEIGHFINESGAPGFQDNSDMRQRRLAHDSKLFKNTNDSELFYKSWYEQGVFKEMNINPNFMGLIKEKAQALPEMLPYWKAGAIELSVAKQEDLSDLSKLPPSMNYHYIHGRLDVKYSSYAPLLREQGALTYEVTDASHNTHFMSPTSYLRIIKEILK